ncbi:MAG: uroporphyrinogen-III synthase [Bacteroidales bacterium]|nr:uroporphyrinogen-III synthase [Bacteroidales bacterium]
MTTARKNNVPRLVISTQPVEQAEKLKSVLSESGIDFLSLPMIRTETAEPDEDVLSVLKNLSGFDRMIFTSKNGVVAFASLLVKLQISFPEAIPVAVIGKGTAAELQQSGSKNIELNPGNTSADFAVFLNQSVLKSGENVLLVQGSMAPDFLEKELSQKATVTRINVYHTLPVEETDLSTIEKIKEDQYGLLVFSSPSAFTFFSHYVDPHTQKLRILSIGSTTTAAIKKTADVEIITAEKPDTKSLKKEIIHYFN